MGFAETFGEIVGYSIYFVVGSIWLAFLGVGACVLSFYVFTFCAQFSCWGIAFNWVSDVIKKLKEAVMSGVATVSRLPKAVVKSCTDSLHSIREAMSCKRNDASDTEIAMVTSRDSSDETPLLHERESYNEDDLPEAKIDIIIDPPSRNSVSATTDELPMMTCNTLPPYSQ
ncbi:hypothetical protein BDC45DRAFT_21920 [Circinella umbellata]|nr:hypothetical protein BDC45DRAFT_21920 [Circinella umbellata]